LFTGKAFFSPLSAQKNMFNTPDELMKSHEWKMISCAVVEKSITSSVTIEQDLNQREKTK